MSKTFDIDGGVIGPNAILQMVPVLERMAGKEEALNMLRRAGISAMPDGKSMIPEEDAARLHQWLRSTMGDGAAILAAEAGQHTALYILRHRIPRAAQWCLRALPAPIAARLLAKAITQHAWTFAGSGTFRAREPWSFEIVDNPIVRGETSSTCLCHWHAMVFETLYRQLVHPSCTCRETACAAQPGRRSCAFALSCGPRSDRNLS